MSVEEDPLERLAAEEDWSKRARAVEHEVARDMRKVRPLRRPARRTGGRDRISKIFLVLVALTLVSAGVLWAGTGPFLTAVTVFVFVLSGWLVTLCLHEFSHALTAHHGGDDSVVAKGYLRLDPRRYGHPVLTLLLPLAFLVMGGIPLPGGAVMIESHRLRNRFRDALVSAAGPAVNVAAAIVLLGVVSWLGPDAIYDLSEPHAPFWAALSFLAYLQVATAILNLMPIPGLDGYGIFEPYLRPETRRTGAKIKPFGVLILFGLLFVPPVRAAFGDVVGWFVDGAGAPINGAAYGYILFQFWN